MVIRKLREGISIFLSHMLDDIGISIFYDMVVMVIASSLVICQMVWGDGFNIFFCQRQLHGLGVWKSKVKPLLCVSVAISDVNLRP